MPDDTATQPRILILSGPSGVGKTTIVHRLLESSAVPLEMSISATTRPIRPNEVDGKNYYFLSDEDFQKRRANGEFVECAEVHRSGHWYGTLRSELERIHQRGCWVLLEIDVEGALNVMQLYPQAVSVFLQTPSADEYERRLRARGTETEEVIQKRLRTAREELKCSAAYTYRVTNDNLERAVREIRELLIAKEAE